MGLIFATGLAAVLVAGVVLLVVGWRGRKINDHPVCPGCGFDLVGVYPGVETCPECGAGLKRERGVRVGARRRRKVTLAAGVVLLVVALVGLVPVAVLAAAGSNLDRYKPVGLLLWEGRNGRADVADRAGVELLRRESAGELDGAAQDRVAAAVLQLQGDLDRPWSDAWGDLFLALPGRSLGELALFDAQSIVPSVEVRPLVRAGGPIPLMASSSSVRWANQQSLMVSVYARNPTVNGTPALIVAGNQDGPEGGDGGRVGVGLLRVLSLGRGVVTQETGAFVTVPDEVVAGPIEVRVEIGLAQPLNDPEFEPPVVWHTVEVSGVTLSSEAATVSEIAGEPVAANQRSVLRLPQEADRNAAGPIYAFMMLSLPADIPGLSHAALLVWPDGREQFLQFVTSGQAPRMLPAWLVRQRSDVELEPRAGRNVRLTSFSGNMRGASLPVTLAGPLRGEPRLVLRPEPWVAELTLDQTEVAGEMELGEVRIESMP